jgi:predicted transcriptional regulator
VRISKEQRERLSKLAETRGMRAEQVLDELLAAAEDGGDLP